MGRQGRGAATSASEVFPAAQPQPGLPGQGAVQAEGGWGKSWGLSKREKTRLLGGGGPGTSVLPWGQRGHRPHSAWGRMELSLGPKPGSEGKGQSDMHTAGADASLLLLQRGQNSGFGGKKGRSTPTGFWVA